MTITISNPNNPTDAENLLLHLVDKPASGYKKTEYANGGSEIGKITIDRNPATAGQKVGVAIIELDKLLDLGELSDEIHNLLFEAKLKMTKAQLKMGKGG